MKKSHIIVGAVLGFSALLIAGLVSFYQYRSNISKAEKPLIEALEPSFRADRVLVKVKKQARGKIRVGNVSNFGLSSLNTLKKDDSINVVTQAIKPGKKANTSAAIFSWYVVNLAHVPAAAPVEGILNKKTGILETKEANVQKLQDAITTLRKDPDVEAVEPAYTVSLQLAPNDPYFSSTGTWGQSYRDLWGLSKIGMEQAWEQSTGSASIVVADIDTGLDRNHEDIKDNVWVNTGEVPSNGIDEDGNGYVDDYFGWNFVNNTGETMDDHGHGTHTAGTIAAMGNNGIGITGVSWSAKILPVKFLDNTGHADTGVGALALVYAADRGARISSNSWGCGCQSQITDDAVAYEHEKGMTVVVSAGNSSADALNYSPASNALAITVGATDSTDALASFSNRGPKIDVVAPGVDILSLRAATNPMCTPDRTVNGLYCRVSGTSMSAPHIAGLAALMLSKSPTLTNEQIRQILRASTIDLGTLGFDTKFGYGRVDAGVAMTNLATPRVVPIIHSPYTNVPLTGVTPIVISVTGDTVASYIVEMGAGRVPTAWTTIASGTTPGIRTTVGSMDPTSLSDGTYTLRLTATNSVGAKTTFQVFDITVDNFESSLSFPRSYISRGVFDLTGTVIIKNGLTLDHYSIEWKNESSQDAWSSSGITVPNGGNTNVVNGVLGTWDTTALTPNTTYSLRISSYATNGKFKTFTETIMLDGDMVSGWPKVYEGRSNGYDDTVPAVADLDGDGQKEVVILQTLPPKIHAFRKDGTELAGFPYVFPDTRYPPNRSVNIDDVDGDGKKEIITVAGRYIYLVRADGSNYPNWPTSLLGGWSNTPSYDHTPIVVDLDGNHTKELVFMEPGEQLLRALTLSGAELVGFPKTMTFTNVPSRLFYASLSAADMDRDGFVEIAFGYGKNLYLYDHQGNLLPGWPFTAPQSTVGAIVDLEFLNSAAFADVDGDGKLEIAAIAEPQCIGSCHSALHVFKKDGTPVSGFPVADIGMPSDTTTRSRPPIAADVNGDRKDEIIIGHSDVRAFSQAGLVFKQNLSAFSGAAAPSAADTDGDGFLNFTSIYDTRVSIINEIGATVWERTFVQDGYNFFDPGVLADLDNNGKMELIVHRNPWFLQNTLSSLYIWELPKSGTTLLPYDWPMIGLNAARIGRLLTYPLADLPTPTPTVTSTPTLTPTPTPYNPRLTPTQAPVRCLTKLKCPDGSSQVPIGGRCACQSAVPAQ